MRTSLFYALNGALGVVAHESLAYFKIDSGKEEYHHSLDGCGKHGKHKWVPDPSTFVFPQHDYKPGNSWDLCVDSAHCAPHEALSKVYFDFKDNAIVFDFKHIEHYKYEDVVVYIERGKPPGEHSQKYSKESDHCVILQDYKQAKCQIPYFSLTDGGSYDELCPIKDNGGWRLYIKIKAKISHGYKKYGLYSRAGDVHEKYFTLSYTCAECKDYKHEGKYELLEEGHEKEKKYDGYKDEKKYNEYKDEKKYDEYKYEEEKKYNDYKYEKGDKKYKRSINDYDGEKYDHEHHKHHHKHYDHGHHGYDHDEHHYDHHNKHHDDGYDHEHKHKHHNPYKHDHDKDYEHGHHRGHHYGHHYGHHDNEHKHYDHGHHHGHHGDYKHHEHYDPSRHHDFNAFLNSYFDKYGHHDYNHGKHHHKHHDGYNHHHARGLDSEETKNGEKSEKLEQKSEDEKKHKHHHHGHHHDHKHDHLHKHRHSHYDYHHYEHYDPGYYYHHEYKHHDHKNHGHNDYNHYDHKNYDHKHHDHKHHDHKDHGHHDYDHKHHDYGHHHGHHHGHHGDYKHHGEGYGHKDYDHKHHDHKDYNHKDHDNKDYGHHHDHHKHYEHHDPSYHHEDHKYHEHYDPSYHHDHHKHHDYKHGDKYDHHHHSKRSSHEYQHHSKHHEEPPVTVYYKEKAEDVNAQANHVIYEKEQKHEIPAHIYKKLAEASKKHQYDHEKKYAHEHNHKHIHEDHKHAEENYHQMKLAEAKLSQAIEEYYAIRYGKQHNEAHGHKKHEYHHKEPEHKHYNDGHYVHKEHKPAHEHHYGHYEHNEHKPEHKHHFGHDAKVIEPEHKHHYGHHEHKPENGYYEKKEFEHKKENEHNKYSHAVYEHKYGPKEYHEHNKYEPEKQHYQHHEHKEHEPSKHYHAHHEPSYYHNKKEFQKHYNHQDGNVHVAFEKLWREKASHQQKQNEKYAAVHYEQHPHEYGHYSKRSALPGHGDEVVEIDTAKVDKYISKAEYNINDGISKAIYKAINSAGEDPTTGTIIKFYKKVEKAIKYIVFKNLKKAVHHITHVDGIREPESQEVDKKIYKAIKHILEAADAIFTKTIDALGEDPTEKEIEYAVAKVEKLLARVVDKYVREAIIEIFDLEYITENSYGYYEKHEKYEKRQVQNATESAVNATATAANSTVEAASKKEDQAANRFMRLFMRQDSQNATAVNTTDNAANATETQTLMRFMRRQEPSVKNATEASINATAQAVADVAEAVNATVEAANVTETQTLMNLLRRQDQNATASAANTTTQAVADVEQALNTTSEVANTTESRHSKRVTVHVYPDGKTVVGQPKIFQSKGAYQPIKFVGKKNDKRDGAKFYNGYVSECKGKVVKAYGIDGYHSGPMQDFAWETHPNTCYKNNGEYLVYTYHELQDRKHGKLYESNGGNKKFGNYFIEMVKGRNSYEDEIVVSIDIHDKYQYEVSEARVYVGCGPGTDDHHGNNICSDKTYPYKSVAEKGLNEFVFAFSDVYTCDAYFVAIVVDFCDNKYSS